MNLMNYRALAARIVITTTAAITLQMADAESPTNATNLNSSALAAIAKVPTVSSAEFKWTVAVRQIAHAKDALRLQDNEAKNEEV